MNLKTNLFERVESGKGLFAVETISLIYNALTSILILLLYTRMDHPGTMLLERAGIVVLTFTLIFLYQAFPCRLTAFVRMVVQMSKALAALLRTSFEISTTRKDGPKNSLPLHRAVLDAVIARQPQKAEKAILVLIDGAREDIETVLASRRKLPILSSPAPLIKAA